MLKDLQNRILSKLEEGLSPDTPESSVKHQVSSLAAHGLAGTLWRVLIPSIVTAAAVWGLFLLMHALMLGLWPVSDCQAACFSKSAADCCAMSVRFGAEVLLFAMLTVICNFAAARLQAGDYLQQSALASALLLISVLTACLLLPLPIWLMPMALIIVPLCGFWGYRLALEFLH